MLVRKPSPDVLSLIFDLTMYSLEYFFQFAEFKNSISCWVVSYSVIIVVFVNVFSVSSVFIEAYHLFFDHLSLLLLGFAVSATPQNNKIFTFVCCTWTLILFLPQPHFTKLSPFFCHINLSHACWWNWLLLLLRQIWFMRL